MRKQSYNPSKPKPKGPHRSQPQHLKKATPPTKLQPKPQPAPKIKQYTVTEPAELLTFLLAHITNQGRNAIKSMLARGQVSVNGQTVTTYNHQLHPGQTVTLSKERIVEAPALTGLSILHEDDDIIIIHKEAGLLSIASPQENEVTAYRQLMAHVRRDDPSNRIFVVHRLDRDTSGVMMFAKSEQIQQALQNTWKDTVQERTYIALVEGMVKKPEGTISSWLKESKTLKMYSSPYPNDGQHAVTHYKVIQANRHFSLLEVNLETGRKNQIRVHMEDLGHPIVGDKKYGAKTKVIGRLGLHARVLSFTHPTTGELMRFESPIPKVFLRPFQETASK
ncbi:RluA family pseudouridine synthase [Brevibacillus dissolubilis]|uniref:RluA family pseudouridine synthase n=1 Tax=Brevibacillus dissolubilis TaxID=1844116 RepID=UPI0011166F84|nr:RluA family pseudouridine synthase [Brevibacillus dissolubilis]